MSRRTVVGMFTLILLLSLTLGAVGEVYKDEVVYAKLKADGTVDSVYIINAFEADSAQEVLDYGQYSQTLPLGEVEGFSYQDGQARFLIHPGRFSFQGTRDSKALPWDLRLSFLLDGQPVEPEQLSGAKGHLEGKLSIAVNEDLQSYANSLSLQITLTLDSELCFNIISENATHAVAGGSRTLSFVVLPGQSAEYTFGTDVIDFSMAGMQAAGIRMGLDAQMYQNAAASALAGSFLEGTVSALMGNFLSAMQGQPAQSFADERNTVRSLQFILLGEAIQPRAAETVAEEPLPETFWDRVLKIFGL